MLEYFTVVVKFENLLHTKTWLIYSSRLVLLAEGKQVQEKSQIFPIGRQGEGT